MAMSTTAASLTALKLRILVIYPSPNPSLLFRGQGLYGGYQFVLIGIALARKPNAAVTLAESREPNNILAVQSTLSLHCLTLSFSSARNITTLFMINEI
jgi:hypothetical protein